MSIESTHRDSVSVSKNTPAELAAVYQIRMNEFCSNFIAQPSSDTQMPTQVTRPKPSISPIDPSSMPTQADSFLAPESNYTTHLSPFVGPRTLHFESSQPTGCSPFVSLVIKKEPSLQNKHLLAVQGHSIPKMGQFQSTPSKLADSQFQASSSSFLSPLDQNVYMSNKQQNSSKSLSRVNFHSIHDLAKSSSSSSDESSISSSSLSSSNSIMQDTGYASSQCLSFNESLKNISESIMANKENCCDESQLSSAKVKRKPRTSINKQQREILEYAYKMKAYPDSNEVEYLCNLLGFEENVIRIWFQNKRARNKQNRHFRQTQI